MTTLLTNATWVDPTGRLATGELFIRDGRLERPSPSTGPAGADVTFDLHGLLIVPGMIDTHVHFREPGDIAKEGIRNGSLAALYGGVTTVLDMPNNRPPCNTARRLADKRERFRRKCLVNWGLHMQAGRNAMDAGGATDRPCLAGPVSYKPARKDVAAPGLRVASAKVYMARSSAAPAITAVTELTRVFAAFRTVTIHAEDETRFRFDRKLHHEVRPRAAIVAALDKIGTAYAAVPAAERPRLILCHLSTADEVAWLAERKRAGWDIWGETAPHYLLFDRNTYCEGGAWFQVNPPLRDPRDRDALWDGIAAGTIDILATDHAPHTRAQKESSTPASGIAGIEWSGPLTTAFVDEGRMTWRRWLELTVVKPARCYGIRGRDGLVTGNWADLAVVSACGDVAPLQQVISKTGFNPYAGCHFSRQIIGVMINGAWALTTEALLRRRVSARGGAPVVDALDSGLRRNDGERAGHVAGVSMEVIG